jgi:hypothetical protein
MVSHVPTSVTAVIFIGVAVPIALIVPIAVRLAMRVVTAEASVMANHTGRQSKDTCDYACRRASRSVRSLRRVRGRALREHGPNKGASRSAWLTPWREYDGVTFASMPIPPPPWACSSSFGASATITSVVSNRPATDAGKLTAAMVTVMKGTRDRRDWFTDLPRLLLTPMIGMALRGDGEEAVAIRELVPTVRYDIRLVAATAGQIQLFGAIRMPVLLMGGDNSNPYLSMALDALQHELPQAERVELKGIGHMASDNVGKPRLVVSELRRFLV